MAAQPGRIFDHLRGEEEREQTDGHIDEEDPAPVVVVGNPAAEGGTNGGCDHNGHAVHRKRQTTFLGREGVGENGLLAGTHAAAARALQDAEENQQRQGRRQSAQDRRNGEQGNAGHVETLASDDRSEPARHGQHDRVGNQVAGEHPGGFVLPGAESAGNVGQSNIGDGGVEHLHEGCQGHGERDDPRVVARLPGGSSIRFYVSHVVRRPNL